MVATSPSTGFETIMNILVYSYFAPRNDHLAGGVQSFLHYLLRGLIQSGEDVTVLSPESDEDDLLDLGPKLSVFPVLLEPNDRSLKPYERHYNTQYYSLLANAADVVLTLDRTVPVETDTPVVLSLNNFSYSTEVDSAFGLHWDAMVVPSDYLRRCVDIIFGPEFWSGGQRPIYTIALPVDTNYFHAVDTTDILRKLNIDKSRFKIIYPHRPDPTKGLDLAIDTLKNVVRREPNSLLLVPGTPDSVRNVRARERKILDDAKVKVLTEGLENHVLFHDWIGLKDLPAYFSMADVCLALGTLPETFGLSLLQSVSCLTPVVTTPSGAIPEVLPPNHGVHVVDFNSPAEASDAIFAKFDPKALNQGRMFINERYSVDNCVHAYIECLRTTKKSRARYDPNIRSISKPIPWIRPLRGKIWHDYEMRYLTRSELEMLDHVVIDNQIMSSYDTFLRHGILLGPLTKMHQKP